MKKAMLCILDGFGLRKEPHGNAVAMAKHPNFDYLWNNFPHSTLVASGSLVGLPEGQMGNSEVGHLNIGAGRIVYQPLELINSKIKDGTFFENKEILDVMNHVKKNDSSLHIFGLLSDGGVHSHINHLFALIDMCKKENIKKVYYHVFLDGRDTLPNIGIKFLDELNKKIEESGVGSIATISGRYYAMDRDNRWDRIHLAYDAIVNGIGEEYSNYKDLVDSNEKRELTDEFVVPGVIDKNGMVKENDGLIVFNFRPDRLRELFMSLTNPNFNEFEHTKFNNLRLVTMMKVSDDVITTNAFHLEKLDNTFGDYVSSLGLSQLRIAETEKYAHVTYFFDGGKELDLAKCKRILIPSPKVATYDMQPEMSAPEITNALIKELANHPDLIVLNFANGDMVGHTGVYPKGIIAVDTVDTCIKKILDHIDLNEYTVIITADHGNCEQMINDDGTINTAHTTNLVPFIVLDKNIKLKTLPNSSLANIAPTILKIMDIEISKEMTGTSLI